MGGRQCREKSINIVVVLVKGGGGEKKKFNEDVEGVKENLGRGYMERNHSGSVETRGNL